MKRRKFERRLQKALNHVNKTLVRLEQLDEMDDGETVVFMDGGERQRSMWWFLAREMEGFRRRILFEATVLHIELDPTGLPAENRR